MISKLNKTDFPKKEFNNGRVNITLAYMDNVEVLMKKINEMIEQINIKEEERNESICIKNR